MHDRRAGSGPEAGLAALREPAPASVLPTVLFETGLVHGYAEIESPVGRVFVGFGTSAVSALRPAEDGAAFAEWMAARRGRKAVPARLPEALRKRIDRAFATGRLADLQIDLEGLSPFQEEVLEVLVRIPPGEVRSYGWVARRAGRPAAARAVGSAVARNPIPILVPCHRVVRSDGRVGEYALGAQVKRDLLRAEGVDPDELDAWADLGRRFLGSDTTRIYCHPTCAAARRITHRHQRWFGSAGEAAKAGYRPCRRCRPEPAVV